ncbi:uncharacterized protein BX664DRAFT_331268 [Halteromyces radiatus]|uniref:uncharacterized protein n=1 Tax=Halteromyces radiatus TaxID=101107 RepID=UPI0022206BD4|nr:uncharacterized protein BX664DRAFT_331268 [Halteromyces radiatus]KAI8088742.1 hypothetical protein BX664DRAFT_331268 [Halteromyces radiatus]
MTVPESPLESFLSRRPDAKDLVDKNILKDPHVAPAIQQQRDELSKRRVEDSLRHKISHSHRPSPESLVQQNILQNFVVAPAFQKPIYDTEKIQVQKNLEQKIADRPSKNTLLNQGILQAEQLS